MLVADDDPETLTLVRSALEEEGFTVDTAVNGKQTLDMLHGELRYGLVLLDLGMPVVSGWEVLQLLDRDDVPIVVVSAHVFDAKTMSAAARIRKTAGFVTKPVNVRVLLDIAHHYCDGEQSSGASQ